MPMSAYKGARGPNVSQYIANLNQLSPPQDMLADPQPVSDDFSAFLNTDFFDINGGTGVDLNAPIDFDVDFDAAQPAGQPAETSPSTITPAPKSDMEFNLNGDFQFTDFNNFGAAPIIDPTLQPLPQQHSAYPLPTSYSTPTSALSPLSSAPFDASSKKRKAEDSLASVQHLDASVQHLDASVQHLDEHGRVAAEEDKRRRNTAASARFRVKKKQREQALEKSAKEMSDRVTHLETKIQQLETENAWLKSLITEKSGGKSSTDELKALISQREESQAGRSSPAHVEGVGTKA